MASVQIVNCNLFRQIIGLKHGQRFDSSFNCQICNELNWVWQISNTQKYAGVAFPVYKSHLSSSSFFWLVEFDVLPTKHVSFLIFSKRLICRRLHGENRSLFSFTSSAACGNIRKCPFPSVISRLPQSKPSSC